MISVIGHTCAFQALTSHGNGLEVLPDLKNKLIWKWKFSHYLLSLMSMEDEGKFCSPKRLKHLWSLTSKQHVALTHTTAVDGDFKMGEEKKKKKKTNI